MEVLSGYNKDYRSMIDNLCEVVLGNLIGHMLAGKDLSASDLNQEEYERLQEMVRQEELGYAVDNISVRMKTVADNGNYIGKDIYHGIY